MRRLGAGRMILAVPVAPADALEEFEGLADEVVCLARIEPFLAVGRAYEDFEQVDDETVASLLAQARAHAPTKRG